MDHKGFLHRVLFLDIETVSQKPSFGMLTNREQELFSLKTAYQRRNGESAEEMYHKAGIWAEFGKIICISTVAVKVNGKAQEVILKSFYGDNEGQLLRKFKSFLEINYNKKCHLLCAHNGKEFDFPFLARRMLINRIPLPDILNLLGKKPWEVRHLDTMELWKFGDYKHYTSLDLLAYIFRLESPKNDIKGADINAIYYGSKDMDRIVKYCEKDTLTVLRVYLKLMSIKDDFCEE